MPDGRMLKKAICTSKKLAELETDTARLLYTWMIPHLDVDGRLSADPHVIKGTVVPRIKSITPEIVENCIKDMQRVGLIIVYVADDDFFLQFHVFSKHQNIHKDREKASIIPPPTQVTHVNSCVAHVNSCQDKIREDNVMAATNVAAAEEIPFYKNEYFRITDQKACEYCEAYKITKSDLTAECKKMNLWLDNNPGRRKKNYGRFITNWLNNRNNGMSKMQEPNYKRGKQEIKDMVDRARLRRKELKAIDGGNKEGHPTRNNRDPTVGDQRGKAPDEEVPDPAA